MTEFKKVAVLIKPTECLAAPLEALIQTLEAAGCEVFLSERSAKALGANSNRIGYSREFLGKSCDLAVVLGGDGTMLSVARSLSGHHIPMIGINAGRLGFITDIVIDEMAKVLPPLLNGAYTRDERTLIGADIVRDGQCVYSQVAVNDIGVSHGRAGGMVEFVIHVDGQQISSQLADGIICSTTTGSTAYSLASGGPILHPSLQGVCLVPVAPHTLSSRPIVLPLDVQIDIQVTSARDAVAYFDMQEFFDLRPGDTLRIRNTDRTFVMLHPEGYDYFDLLRRKLNWNFMPARAQDAPGAGSR